MVTPPIAAAAGSPTWRRGIRAVLADLGTECVEFEALDAWTPGAGGVAVIVWIGDEHGFAPLEAFAAEYPHIPVVAMLPLLDLAAAARAIRAGASGVIDESDPVEVIGEVLAAARSDRISLPRRMAVGMADRVPQGSVDDWITAEQAAWLTALAEGVTVSDLAERIGWSERETFRMLGDLYRRLGARNRTEAIIWATRHGLLG